LLWTKVSIANLSFLIFVLKILYTNNLVLLQAKQTSMEGWSMVLLCAIEITNHVSLAL